VSDVGSADGEVDSPSSMMSECNNVSLQTESLDPGLERNEVMKLAASSYPITVDVVLSEFVSEHASSRIGNVVDPARAAFVAFLAAFFRAFFFCFFDKPPPSCDALDDAFVNVAVEAGRTIPMPLAAGLWGADRDNPEIAEDNSSSVPVEPSEKVRVILRRGDRGRLRTTKSSSSVSETKLLSSEDSDDEACGSQTTSSSDVIPARSDEDPDIDDTKSYEAVDDGERRRWALVGDVAIEVIAKCKGSE